MKKWLFPCIAVIFVITILFYTNIQKSHTFTLMNNETPIKSEQIQPY